MPDISFERVPELETPHQRIYKGDFEELLFYAHGGLDWLNENDHGNDALEDIAAFLAGQGLVPEGSQPVFEAREVARERKMIGSYVLVPQPALRQGYEDIARRMKTELRGRDLDVWRYNDELPPLEKGMVELRVYAYPVQGSGDSVSLPTRLRPTKGNLPENLYLAVSALLVFGGGTNPYSIDQAHRHEEGEPFASQMLHAIQEEITGNNDFIITWLDQRRDNQRYRLNPASGKGLFLRLTDETTAEKLVNARDTYVVSLQKLMGSAEFQKAVALRGYNQQVQKALKELTPDNVFNVRAPLSDEARADLDGKLDTVRTTMNANAYEHFGMNEQVKAMEAAFTYARQHEDITQMLQGI